MKVVVGLGKTGLSVARFLARQKVDFVVMDSREEPPEKGTFQQLFPQVPLILGKVDPGLIQKAEELILSPGLSPAPFPLEKSVSDIEVFAREAKAPIVAITGTNAKGTVTTLVGEMIKASGLEVLVGGNIGTPALDLLAHQTPDYYVLEISSFQLESIHYLPLQAATILNLSPDHLDRHKTMENYQRIKQRIYQQAKTAVFNRGDADTFPLSPTPHQISFGLDVPLENQFGVENYYLTYGTERWLPVSTLKIKGQHNVLNALAALALGQAIHLPKESMLEALQHFPGLPHRCEWITHDQEVDWYNDSKGTNVGATLAALEGLGVQLSGKLILIAGGLGKGADFSVLQKSVSRYVKHLILMGQDAPIMAKTLTDYTQISFASSLKEAVLLAKTFANPGDAVLLSPACASWDMFRDFEERGNQFRILVKELSGQ